MISDSALTVITRAVLDWAGPDAARLTWLTECAVRHLNADWGDIDADDRAANDYALRHRQGRVLSAYDGPAELADDTTDRAMWVITDDLEDPDTAATILFPSDY
jgi:hypothetical protein